MNVFQQFRNGFPLLIYRYLFANIEVNTRNDEIPSRPYETRNATQTLLGCGWLHVTEEVVGYNKFLGSQQVEHARITYIAVMPDDAFSNPRFNGNCVSVPVKHLLYFRGSQALKNPFVHQFRACKRVSSLLGKLQNLFGNIHGMQDNLQLRPGRAERSKD